MRAEDRKASRTAVVTVTRVAQKPTLSSKADGMNDHQNVRVAKRI